jgi:hypothetical protein
MLRTLLGIVVGCIAWFAIGALGFFLMRAAWPDYALAEPEMTFTLGMQLSRLAVAVACSVGAGWVAALVARGNSAPAWWLGVLLVLFFIPIHYSLWDKFPVWYHLFFLLTLAPIVGLSARLAARRSVSRSNAVLG